MANLTARVVRLRHYLTGWSLFGGVLATLLVIALDAAGSLRPIERLLYDARARHCQFCTPAPSERVAHVDIDDAALETVGRWPWGRATVADIVDEVRLAGADALSVDVLFSEPQPVQYVPEGPAGRPATGPAPQPARPSSPADAQRFAVVDHDEVLEAAIRRYGRVMVGVSFDNMPAPPEPPLRQAATEVLTADPELTREEVLAKLPPGAATANAFNEEEFVFARRKALGRRIDAALAEMPLPVDALRPKLLPRMGDRTEGSSLARQYVEAYREVAALRGIARFTHDVPADCPPLLNPVRANALPLPAFAESAWVSGYVDYLPNDPAFGDGILRSVPLWVNFRGRLYPQMDLAVACAVLGADVRQVRVSADEVVIPTPDGGRVAIPVRSVRADKRGAIGAVVDIPWFGTEDWKSMYDYPGYHNPVRHVPAAELWGLAASRRVLAKNYPVVREAMKLLAAIGSGKAEAFAASPPPVTDVDAWATAAEAALREVEPALEPIRKDPPEKRNADDQQAVKAADTVAEVAAEGRKVLAKANVIRQRLAGKVVLFGGTATSLGDVKPTSLHNECPGVVVHGVVINALLSGHFWRAAPPWVTPLITLALGLLVTAFVTWMSPGAAAASSATVVAGYAAVNGLLLFDYGDWVVGAAGPLTAAATVWVVLTMLWYVAEKFERARIVRKFQRYVDPALVNYVIAHPDKKTFEGEVREMTVVFTDLAGYTQLTEKLRERAVRILGRYKTVMVPAIRRHRGFIHSFMGDGIMFSYGAPEENSNHAVDALNTILDVQEVMRLFNAELATQNLGPLVTRVGVCTGPAVVGDSGSEEGSDYACLGNTTNLAARLESANKAVGTVMMISERTAELLGGRFLLRPIAKLTVKGKTIPEMTFEPLAPADEATDDHRRLAALTAAMFDAYVAGRFADCAAAADAMDAAVGPSKLAALYRETAQEYLAAGGPPAGFQGQIVLKEK